MRHCAKPRIGNQKVRHRSPPFTGSCNGSPSFPPSSSHSPLPSFSQKCSRVSGQPRHTPNTLPFPLPSFPYIILFLNRVTYGTAGSFLVTKENFPDLIFCAQRRGPALVEYSRPISNAINSKMEREGTGGRSERRGNRRSGRHCPTLGPRRKRSIRCVSLPRPGSSAHDLLLCNRAYTIPIKFGEKQQQFSLQIDTGSSDLVSSSQSHCRSFLNCFFLPVGRLNFMFNLKL